MKPSFLKSLLFAVLLAGPASAQQDFVQVGELKASVHGLLARLKPANQAKAVNAMAPTLQTEGMIVDPNFKCEIVPGLVRLCPNPQAGVRIATLTTGDSLLKQVKDLMETGLFEYVEPDWIVTTQQTPTDPSYADGTLWGIRNTGAGGGTAGIDVNATPAWGLTTGSRDINVAVIDTGIRYTHQDLRNNMWTNPGETPGNNIDDDGNGYVDDVYGINAIANNGNPMDDNNHGTHCAGTIAATANDSGPIVGVAYNVRLMACKFLSAGGSGNTSDAVECLAYATRMGAHISSNSWGGGGSSQAMLDAIRAANTAGRLFVAAAGNSSSNNDTVPTFPANYDSPNVVSVAAIDRNGALASFSSFGRTKVHVGAPGVAVYSSTAGSDTSYASFSGTSMACPHAAGVAALIKSLTPGLTPTQIRERMVSTARPLASLNGRTVANGMVNAHAALLAGADGTLDLTLASTGTSVKSGKPAAFFISVTDGGPITGASVTGTLGDQTTPFLDNGVAPDATAGDAVYSATLTVPSNATTTVTLSASATASGKSPGSNTRAFTVIPPPSNDRFENRVVLAIGSTTTTGNNRNASMQTGEPTGNPTTAGGQTTWWEWNAGATGPVTITTVGSSFDTTLAVYSGFGTLESLGLIASNDDATGITSSVTFNANLGGVYYIQVDGSRGAEGDIKLNYPSPGQASGPPFITTQPLATVIVEEDSLTLSVSAGGTIPLSFQWLKNGTPISGASGVSYNIASASPADSGSYTVQVSNPFGNITSQPAVVTVDPVSVRPANDKFVNAEMLSGSSGRVTGANLRASGQSGEPNHAGNSTPIESVWYRWTATASGNFTVDTYGSSFDTTLAVYTGSQVNALTEVVANDDSGSVQSFVATTVTAGQTYYIAVDGTASNEGTIALNYNLQPIVPGLINDNFTNRTVLGSSLASATGSIVGATAETNEPQHTPNSAPTESVWWSWTAPTSGIAVIDTQGSNFDTSLAVYTGSNVGSLVPVASNDDFGGPRSQVQFNCVAGVSYAIAVDGSGSAQGSITLNIVSGTTTPEIVVEQPAGTGLTDGSSTVNFGTTLNTRNSTRTFTIRNTGAAGLTGLGISISGAHAGEFTVTAVPTAPLAPAPAAPTTFTVRFIPTDSGTRNATLRISSNDSDESPFDINLTGTGIVVPPDIEFRILSLGSTGTTVTDSVSGDDRTGIAVSNSTLFVNGDTAASRRDASTLGNGVSTGRIIDGLCSDIGTGKIYTLANNGNSYVAGGTTVNQLIELDGTTGALTGNIIQLSAPVTIGSDAGLFSGNGRVVLHNGTNAIDIRIPSGAVIDIGAMTRPAWLVSESWAVHGAAEFFGGQLYIGYRVNGANRIDRSPVPSGAAQTIANFTNLGDIANWTVNLARNRWYFSHEGASQFGGTGTTTEYVGYADGGFLVLPPPTITSPRVAGAYAGQNFSYQIVASPEVTGYGASGLPAGLTINTSTGLITGNVLATGTYAASISATNAASTTTVPLAITIQTMPTALFDDFDPLPDPALWEQLSGGARANRFGEQAGPGSSGNSLWFGGAGSRHITTLPLDMRNGGRVKFSAALANGSSGRWEAVDPGEQICVEYSTDGVNFSPIGAPVGTNTWGQFEMDIPGAAEAFGTRFRFRQLGNTGPGLDHWAIENIAIGPVVAMVPEIGVEQPAGSPLIDGVGTINFEQTPRFAETTLAFTVRNMGLADLGGLGIQIVGANAGDYSVAVAPAPVVAPGSTTTFTIRFSPQAYGTRVAQLMLSNNDSNESPFDIALRGTSIDPLDFFDDFDPGHEPAMWTQFGGQVSANTRGQAAGAGSSGKSLHFDGNGLRQATTAALDTRGGGTVSFLIALGNSAGPLWENPDAGEDVVLEYTLDGTTFVTMGGPFTSRTWQATNVPIPPAARTAATRFRFRQLAHSGTGLDHWAIEEVRVHSGAP